MRITRIYGVVLVLALPVGLAAQNPTAQPAPAKTAYPAAAPRAAAQPTRRPG